MVRVKPRATARAGDRKTRARARAQTAAIERAQRHAHAAPASRPIGCAVITVSDTRTRADDASGDTIVRRVEEAGHLVPSRTRTRDDAPAIRRAVRAALARADVDVVLLTGGTGIAPRDVTPEALESILDTPLPGFGERFRALSAAQVGSAAWLSRAAAGIARGRLVVALPGSTRAVELALTELVIPELGHVVRLLGRL